MNVEIRQLTAVGSNHGSDYLCMLDTPYIPRVGDILEFEEDYYRVVETMIVVRRNKVNNIIIYVRLD